MSLKKQKEDLKDSSVRQWMSKINLTHPEKHLNYWLTYMRECGDEIATCCTSSNSRYSDGLIYSRGAEEHTDREFSEFSALLIIHNEGFKINQYGLDDKQSPGTIIILHSHNLHELARTQANAKKWAAIFMDYGIPMLPSYLEYKLDFIYQRVFSC